jgi:hypothetical protein
VLRVEGAARRHVHVPITSIAEVSLSPSP